MKIPDQEEIIQEIVGAKIRELRQAANLRAVELAELSGLSQSQVSKIETGKTTISIKALSRLCQVLDRPLSYLFQSEEEIPRVLGTLTTVRGPERQGIIRFVEDVHHRTGGRMSLIPLKASQLFPAGDQVEQLRQGVIDLFIEGLKYFHHHAPGVETFWYPYCFDSSDHMTAFLEGGFFKNVVKTRLLEAGIRLLNQKWNWRRGLEWVLVSNRPIVTPDQLKGLRVRAEELPLSARFWEAMGAKVVTVPWSEVKMALRLGHIDVLPTQKSHIYPMGFCRYARFVTRLGDVSPLMAVAVNDTKYQALPPSIQQALMDACEWSGDYFTRLVQSAEAENQAKNLAEYQAAYLQVDQTPWKTEAARIKKALLEDGTLNRDFWAEVERLRPAVGGRQ